MMRANMTLRRIAAATTVALALALTACGPGPKSQALDDLERQLQDPTAREVKEAPGATRHYEEARQYRRLALESWEEGKEEISEEYAVLGLLRYRTAAAIAEQHEAMARLESANAAVATANPEIKALNDEQLKLAEEVRQLEMQVAQARRRKEEADRRQQAFAQQQSGQTGTTDPAMQQALRNKLNEVESARRAADAVDAATHAPQKYNPAANALKSVQTLLASGKASQPMIDEANTALTLFREAEEAARPKFEVAQEKLNPALRRQKLSTAAQAQFGASNVISEAAGVRVVLAGAFDPGSSTVKASASGRLDALVQLAKSYDEFTLFVEGYTSKGDATENLGLSQLRARSVRDHLAANGVKTSRIETKGQGQDRPRFGPTSSENDRVEVVFTH